MPAAGFRDPILVAATDGVGTKLKVATEANLHDTIGIDLVAMCVNDIVVQGAEPLFFLDYFATGRLRPEIAEAVISGIAEGCRQAGCALIGGETAEMPGHYQKSDYDLAGFAVGAVERNALLTGDEVVAGDIVFGLASNGLHANGFSLVRRIIELSDAELSAPAPFTDHQSLGAALLQPTRIYVPSCLAATRADGLHALAHITGGGLLENLPRVLPSDLAAVIDRKCWPRPPVFDWISQQGGVAEQEMLRTFNCGIGMAAVVGADHADMMEETLTQTGETVYRLGQIVTREGVPGIVIEGIAG